MGWFLAALALALGACGAAGAAPGPVRVVATTPDLKALVEAVGGDRVAVESIAVADQDPHTLELKPSHLARLAGAQLLVRVGLDHEPWLARARIGRETRVLDASKDVRLLQAQTPRLRAQRAAHAHAFGNTHYWLDPANIPAVTAAIARSLAELRGDAAFFEGRRSAFLAELDRRLKAWAAMLAPLRGARVVVMHDTWSYLAERFGFTIVAAVEPTPGVAPSPAELAALFARTREGEVRLLIAEPSSNPALVRLVAEKTGVPVVTLLPSGPDYLKLMDDNVARLTRALEGR